jgi:DNA invertase Pin-like site-specific DNA recombinase
MTYHERSDVIANLDFDRLARAVSGLHYVIEQLATP